MHAEDRSIVRLLAISRDVTASRAVAEELRWASEHDALTELPNRRAFQAHLQVATLRAMECAASVGLLLIDLDHFKHVNDTLGHAAGDLLLKTFGHRLKTCLRAGDYVARLGGDEFAVILNHVDSEAHAKGVNAAAGRNPKTFAGGEFAGSSTHQAAQAAPMCASFDQLGGQICVPSDIVGISLS